jgi:prepilin-type N-terminal cleavage/methylation domain-containing protein
MTLNNIKTMRKDRGFTIVELLIVIVVIAILAAIVIVAYQGITTKANTTKAQTNGVTAQKVAEAMNADNTSYPATAASFATGSASVKMPTGVTVIPDNLTTPPLSANNGSNTVVYACMTSCTTPTGGRVGWWSFSAGATQYIYLGAATSSSTFVAPTS